LTVKEADDLLAKFRGANVALPKQGDMAYARFEPVPAPVLVPRAAYVEGESLERIVIRSDSDITAADYAARDPARYANTEERHVVAPKASLALVETHGRLDAAFDANEQGLPRDQVRQIIRDTYDLARREKGSLDDLGPDVELVHKDGAPDGSVVYAIHREAQLEVPYLPDPLAQGVVFTGLPGADPSKPFVVLYGGAAWHQPGPLRLRLAEGAGRPEWNEGERVLTVHVEQAKVFQVRAMSLIPDGYFKEMAIFQWCEEAMRNGKISPADFEAIVTAAKENRHWMLTPWREITLVHAVQHPLQEPPSAEFGRLQPGNPRACERGLGQTRAELTAEVGFDFASTARLDLNAAWREPRDRPNEGAPKYGDHMVSVTAHVLDIAIPASGAEPLLIEEDRLALAFQDDTRVFFDASQQREIMPSLRRRLAGPDLTPQQRDDLRRRIELLGQVRPHEFGDTQYRRVRYRFSNTSRFREYFLRLALVRYQPHSVSGAHLSRVVLGDTVQTVPNRTLRVTRDPSQPGVVAVQVSGPAYNAIRRLDDQIMQATSRVQARLEVRNMRIADETLGWEPGSDAPIMLQAQPAPAGGRRRGMRG
jgi:hypothetical protein